MAELASHPDFDSAATTRRVRRDTQAASAARQNLISGAVAGQNSHAQSRTLPASGFTDTAVDRYAFYFFMSSVGLGVLAMVGLALGM